METPCLIRNCKGTKVWMLTYLYIDEWLVVILKRRDTLESLLKQRSWKFVQTKIMKLSVLFSQEWWLKPKIMKFAENFCQEWCTQEKVCGKLSWQIFVKIFEYTLEICDRCLPQMFAANDCRRHLRQAFVTNFPTCRLPLILYNIV